MKCLVGSVWVASVMEASKCLHISVSLEWSDSHSLWIGQTYLSSRKPKPEGHLSVPLEKSWDIDTIIDLIITPSSSPNSSMNCMTT